MLHRLFANPLTIHWGYLSSDLKPVLEIDPGDIVRIETFGSLSPDSYESAGIQPNQIPQHLRDIFMECKHKGPGPHIIVGPIYVNNAEPGDILEVHIKEVLLTMPFGSNSIRHKKGLLPEEFPFSSTKIITLDLEKGTCPFTHDITIFLRPFFGIMAVSPPPGAEVDSRTPGAYGGNIDNKELIQGSILYLPIHVRGALFSVGDGHAAQGDGEVDQTALETGLQGTFQFFVRRNKKMDWPRAETPTHFITMGFHEDLDVAVKMAIQEMIDLMEQEKGMDRETAYRISSIAVDLRVTQVVNGEKGIHAMLPKNIFCSV